MRLLGLDHVTLATVRESSVADPRCKGGRGGLRVRNTGFLPADGGVQGFRCNADHHESTLGSQKKLYASGSRGRRQPSSCSINREAKSLGDAAWGDGGR